MGKKALYKHKKTGDLFAIETDEGGNVISTSGPLLTKDLKPEELDYDNYWDEDIKAHLSEFVMLSKAEYEELLKKTGFFFRNHNVQYLMILKEERSIIKRRNRSNPLNKLRG